MERLWAYFNNYVLVCHIKPLFKPLAVLLLEKLYKPKRTSMKKNVFLIDPLVNRYWMLCLLACLSIITPLRSQTQVCPTNQITNYSFENGVSNIAKTIAGSNATLNDRTNGFGVTGIGTDEGPDISYWIDASSNGGKGSINGNYLIWFNTPAAGNTNKCIQTNVDHYQFVKGVCYSICEVV